MKFQAGGSQNFGSFMWVFTVRIVELYPSVREVLRLEKSYSTVRYFSQNGFHNFSCDMLCGLRRSASSNELMTSIL